MYLSIGQGLFSVTKTGWKLLLIGLDQAHERLNEPMKRDGGRVGLTEDPIKLRRWVTAGPDTACNIDEIEDSYLRPKEQRHIHLTLHEQVLYNNPLPNI